MQFPAIAAVRIFEGINHALAVTAHPLDGVALGAGQRAGGHLVAAFLRQVALLGCAQVKQVAVHQISDFFIGVNHLPVKHHLIQPGKRRTRDRFDFHARETRLKILSDDAFVSPSLKNKSKADTQRQNISDEHG